MKGFYVTIDWSSIDQYYQFIDWISDHWFHQLSMPSLHCLWIFLHKVHLHDRARSLGYVPLLRRMWYVSHPPRYIPNCFISSLVKLLKNGVNNLDINLLERLITQNIDLEALVGWIWRIKTVNEQKKLTRLWWYKACFEPPGNCLMIYHKRFWFAILILLLTLPLDNTVKSTFIKLSFFCAIYFSIFCRHWSCSCICSERIPLYHCHARKNE